MWLHTVKKEIILGVSVHDAENLLNEAECRWQETGYLAHRCTR